MEGRHRLVTLVLLLLLSRTVSQNVTGSGHQKSQHKFSSWWPLLSSIGVLGTIFNSYVLYCFISERNNMVTSVNVMIGMDTTYRLVHSSVAIHWRSYLMYSDINIFSQWIDLEMVTITVTNLTHASL